MYMNVLRQLADECIDVRYQQSIIMTGQILGSIVRVYTVEISLISPNTPCVRHEAITINPTFTAQDVYAGHTAENIRCNA